MRVTPSGLQGVAFMNPTLDLTYSLADQHFQRTKSLGILNFSVQFLNHLARRPEIHQLAVLNNSILQNRLNLPPQAAQTIHDAAISGKLGRIWWDQSGVYSAAKRAGNEWLFLPKGFASFMRRSPVKLLGYLADVMPEYYRRNYPRAMPLFETQYFLWSMKGILTQINNFEIIINQPTPMSKPV